MYVISITTTRRGRGLGSRVKHAADLRRRFQVSVVIFP
jgi:hypothetical protein